MLPSHKSVLLILLILLIPGLLHGQFDSRQFTLEWTPSRQMNIAGRENTLLHFRGASYELNTLLPNFYEVLKIVNYSEYHVELLNPVFQVIDHEQLAKVVGLDQIPAEILIRQSPAILRKEPHLQVEITPLRRNTRTGQVEALTSFSLRLDPLSSGMKSMPAMKKAAAGTSLLASGNWSMIRVDEDGIYSLSYENLLGLGVSNPGSVRLYGHGGGMLPMQNNLPRYDDLQENAVYMDAGSDGNFGPGDHILFYGRSPHIWKYDSINNYFNQEIHAYSYGNYYFLTSDLGSGKRITDAPIPEGSPDYTTSVFDARLHHEHEDINVIKSGREWYGEHFDIAIEQIFPFSFSGLEEGEPLRMKVSVIARATAETQFQVYSGQSMLGAMRVSGTVFSYSAPFAYSDTDTFNFSSGSGELDIKLRYLKNAPSAEGWLNYITLNARSSLVFPGEYFSFRDSRSVYPGRLTAFRLSGASSDTRVWDVTDPITVTGMAGNLGGSIFEFRTLTNSLREFAAFDISGDFPSPVISGDDVGPVPNQDLHSLSARNYVIISHPDFLSQARRLAAQRHDIEGLDTVVVTPRQIYNEFSSGTPDVTALRDFLKMLYDRAGTPDEEPRYVLLFGDGSYDNKGSDVNNTNFIPTYQSANSISQTGSFVTDDFFGLLDDNEGGSTGLVDIGLGRFPVSTVEEADNMVNKTLSYGGTGSMGDWRNAICFIGDDEDGNLHMRQADELARYVEDNYPAFTIGKIYLDAYTQVSTPSGERYPDVNEAFNQRMGKGALIINYTGHGGANGLAHERILNIDDITQWENGGKLPLFMTATCEFSRFDEYESTSAGELVLLNPRGGGIALLSTTRLVYAGPNHELNERFYNYVFDKDALGRSYRLGDIIRLTKNAASGGINKRNFTLLGDPAVMLAYPQKQVRTTSINGISVSASTDTLKALSKVTIEGRVEDGSGNLLGDFNGIIYPAVYDKSSGIATLSNDGDPVFNFSMRNRILYKGKATVSNGLFSFSFIVPKDIAYNYGYGKLSFYSAGLSEDASGAFSGAVIGGSADSVRDDSRGPEIRIYMNDENFVFGGMTDESPSLLVYVNDSSGINTVGSGIGHDITAVLDQQSNQAIVLNDFYEADTDSYRSGKINYPFKNMEAGSHSLKIKVWDVHNNSSEEILDFVVNTGDDLLLKRVLNYPNPFTTHTQFFFEHNRPDQDLEVIIQVFTVSGRLVKTIDQNVPSSGYRTTPIDWDGLDDFGSRIGRGVYIYRVRVRTALGASAEKYEKLVILR